MRGGSTEPARIVAGELFRSVTVNRSPENLSTFGRIVQNLVGVIALEIDEYYF